MKPLVPLADRYAFNDKFLDSLTQDFEDRDWLRRAGDGNHAQWLLGHLASTRRWLLREAGGHAEEEAWEKHFGMGCKPTPAVRRQSAKADSPPYPRRQ